MLPWKVPELPELIVAEEPITQNMLAAVAPPVSVMVGTPPAPVVRVLPV
jgi:hypothetical protein